MQPERAGSKAEKSDLPRPLHSFPDGKIDEHPGQSQSAHQGPAKLPWLLQTARQLVHVTPTGTHTYTPNSDADKHK